MKKKFVDDPKAKEFDKNGKHPTQYSSLNPVFIGKKMPLEQAQEMWRRDVQKENVWGTKRGGKEL